MFYLFLSILLNAYIGVIFAFFHKYKIDVLSAIVFNYGICVLTGSFVLQKFPITIQSMQQPFFHWAILMGILFIAVFNLIAFSSIRVGITITQTANRLSFVIPVVVSILLYHDKLTILKTAGILLALAAVVLVSSKKKSEINTKQSSSADYLLPFFLFLGSGVIDALTKYVQQRFLIHEELSNIYLISGFFIAFLIGSLVLLYFYISKRKQFAFKNLIAGILLGIPNYFSIYFLVKALSNKNLSSSAIIPMNNIGVLFLVSLVGIFFFREKLSIKNYIGLLITLLAISFIYFGDISA